MFHLGYGMAIWSCKEPRMISLAINKIEYGDDMNARTNIVWIHNLIVDRRFHHKILTTV